MEPKKPKGNYWLFIGSIAFIFVALGFVTILNSTSNSGESTDVRAKAGAISTLKLTGTVRSVDTAKHTFVLSDLVFSDTKNKGGKSLGTWTVSAPPGYNLGTIPVGREVTIIINSSTMLATSHTVTATEVR